MFSLQVILFIKKYDIFYWTFKTRNWVADYSVSRTVSTAVVTMLFWVLDIIINYNNKLELQLSSYESRWLEVFEKLISQI